MDYLYYPDPVVVTKRERTGPVDASAATVDFHRSSIRRRTTGADSSATDDMVDDVHSPSGSGSATKKCSSDDERIANEKFPVIFAITAGCLIFVCLMGIVLFVSHLT